MILLPKEAQSRLEVDAIENHRLSLNIEAQAAIMNDLLVSIPDPEEAKGKLANIESELSLLTESLSSSQAILRDILFMDREHHVKTAPAPLVLKIIIDRLIKALHAHALHAVKAGEMNVTMTSVLDIEDQIQRRIDDLCERGMFPESDSDCSARIAFIENHTKKIVEFLRTIGSQESEE